MIAAPKQQSPEYVCEPVVAMEDEPGRDEGGPARRCRVQPSSPPPTPDPPSPGRPGSPAVGVAEADGPPTPPRPPRYPAMTGKAPAGRRSRLTPHHVSRQGPRLQRQRPGICREGRRVRLVSETDATRGLRRGHRVHQIRNTKQHRLKAHRRAAGHHVNPRPSDPGQAPTSTWARPSTVQICRWDSARSNAVAARATAAGPANATAVAPRAACRATVPVSRVSDHEVRTGLRISVGPRAPTTPTEANGPIYRCPPTQHRGRCTFGIGSATSGARDRR